LSYKKQEIGSTLANIQSAKKRARQAIKNRLQNAGQRSHLRTKIKAVVKLIDAGDKAAATEAYKSAVPVLDVSVSKKLIHANKAARHKSRLNARIKAL
jgi:small subunit ribosomal protein S20